MKTPTIILIFLLAININMLFANNGAGDPVKTVFPKTETTVKLTDLAPSLPKEADFTDAIENEPFYEKLLLDLTPVTPREADFEDNETDRPMNIKTFAPVMPEYADFSDQ
ncbi:MAG: hypothetical protein M0Q38_02375 [Bacteroidales bacterium]|jgi:hypothetical protein|nr:hypothetical protein [Bacteroidales bacterium]